MAEVKKLSAEKQEIFERMSVPRAVATLATPTIISQIVITIYNLADTFFIGQMKDPYMVAAISLLYPWMHLQVALANLFGVGSSTLISRMLGSKCFRFAGVLELAGAEGKLEPSGYTASIQIQNAQKEFHVITSVVTDFRYKDVLHYQ